MIICDVRGLSTHSSVSHGVSQQKSSFAGGRESKKLELAERNHAAACPQDPCIGAGAGLGALLGKWDIVTHSHRKPYHMGSTSLWAKLTGNAMAEKDITLCSTGWVGF